MEVFYDCLKRFQRLERSVAVEPFDRTQGRLLERVEELITDAPPHRPGSYTIWASQAPGLPGRFIGESKSFAGPTPAPIWIGMISWLLFRLWRRAQIRCDGQFK